MQRPVTRRDFLTTATGAMLGATLLPHLGQVVAQEPKKLPFKISLAQWSLNQTFFSKKADPLDFAKMAKVDFGIEAVEYVNQFFMDKAKDASYLKELKKRADDHGVTSVLIMCDDEGDLGDPAAQKRAQAIDNHKKWVEAAKFLGCHSIRVNARSSGSYWQQMELAADGLRRLCEFAALYQISVIVENHGGISSNGTWLSSTIHSVNHPACGTLPDFGNFMISEKVKYDRYKGVEELMPFAKGVSAKSNEFDSTGNESNIDYRKMLQIVLSYGYHGWIGIEYEGTKHSEIDGIKLTKALLEKVRAELT